MHDDSESLVEEGRRAYARADFAAAALLFGEALSVASEDARIWLHVAETQRALGDEDGARAAFDRVTELEARNAAATSLPGSASRRARMPRHGGDGAESAAYVAQVDQLLAGPRARYSVGDRQRFDECIDNLLGRGSGGVRHVPGLPVQGFYPRGETPWLDRLEAHAAVIRGELVRMLAKPEPGLVPFVSMLAGSCEAEWSHLDQSLDWAAIHLWRHGERIDAACARCPATAALLDSLPLIRLDGRTPNVSFAVLGAGARLPPHVGVSNIRAVVHLALIVPEACALRVGDETRAWVQGQAFAFDDTVEHEAWNESEEPRAILIIDAWNPHLTGTERELLQVFAAGTVSDLGGLAL